MARRSLSEDGCPPIAGITTQEVGPVADPTIRARTRHRPRRQDDSLDFEDENEDSDQDE